MRSSRLSLVILTGLVIGPDPAPAASLLVPADSQVPPLAMVSHRVTVSVVEQVAVTTVEQVFRNPTDRNLEAIYVFPVPRGASVDQLSMWVDGKEVAGELLDAQRAEQVYTDIVRRTQDPALLEYLGHGLMRLRVFPIPPRSDQKVKFSYKAVVPRDGNLVEYVYPLKTDGKSTQTLEEFSVRLTLESRQPITTVYSPTHAITVHRQGDRKAVVEFERNQALLDKDFQLFYGVSEQDVGLTALLHKPMAAEDGYFLFLLSPPVGAAMQPLPRDLVLVLDVSGSMSDLKMAQAKKALKYCLGQLKPEDRFGLIKFSTTVTPFRDKLLPASRDNLEAAVRWVDGLRQQGGTAILPALEEALALRGDDPARPFTIIFFTDGQPTIDETDPDRIVQKVAAKNTANTRIFTFGVGDDVNAVMLDQLAEATRAVSIYVRPAEDIEAKVASLYGKISHPVLTDLRLTTSDSVRLHDVYPPKLPDLFHGSQLVVLGRYSGSGHATVRLTGQVGGQKKEFVYEVAFPERTSGEGRDFVEPLWARRKVGYLLDQIRVNGEKKELVEEVVRLAKQYGIATPYTSYLVVPDMPLPVVSPRPGVEPRPGPRPLPRPMPLPAPLAGAAPAPELGFDFGPPNRLRVDEFAKRLAGTDGRELAANRGQVADRQVRSSLEQLRQEKDPVVRDQLMEEVRKLAEQRRALDEANTRLKGDRAGFQTGRLGVDLAEASQTLRTQERLTLTANRRVLGRNLLEVGGVWIDDGYTARTPTVTVRAWSDAYFRLLQRHPELKEVFRLGTAVVWVTPGGTALVIDPNGGQETISDAEIDALFGRK